MPKARLDPRQKERSYRLWKDDNAKPGAIRETLVKEFGEDKTYAVASIRTINNWVAEFREKETRLDSLFDPGKVHEYIKDALLSPEVAGYALNLWTWGYHEAPHVSRTEYRVLTIRQALWCWRIHQVAPDAPAGVVVRHSLAFTRWEIFKDVLGVTYSDFEPEKIWLGLAWKSWDTKGELLWLNDPTFRAELYADARRLNLPSSASLIE